MLYAICVLICGLLIAVFHRVSVLTCFALRVTAGLHAAGYCAGCVVTHTHVVSHAIRCVALSTHKLHDVNGHSKYISCSSTSNQQTRHCNTTAQSDALNDRCLVEIYTIC
jgi:hypothetical protein